MLNCAKLEYDSFRQLLSEIGADVEFVPFDGPHTIPEEALIRTVALLESLLE